MTATGLIIVMGLSNLALLALLFRKAQREKV